MEVDDQLLELLTLLAFAFASLVIGLVVHMRRRRMIRSNIDQLLESVPDVLYKEPSAPPPSPVAAAADAAAAGDEDDDDACVICQAAYEVGERCFVLPECKHMFHKVCIAAWLRKHVTCPLCRVAVVAAGKEHQSQLNAAENTV